MSIRWKIALVCIIVTLLPVVFLNHYAVRVFDGFTRKMLEENMIDYAFMAGEEYRLTLSEDGAPDEGFAQRLRDYEAEFGARLQIVGEDGRVLYDSAEMPETGADYSERREVKKALLGRYGARTGLTPDRKRMYYYIALPVRSEGGDVLAAACVTSHTEAITKAIIRMARDYQITLLISLLAAAAAAVLLSVTMTRRLRALTGSVKSFARGDSPMTLKQSGRDEIGELGRAFNQMAEEISKINTQNRNLVSTTTHELKTPLTAIKSSVQLLQEGGALDPETQKKFLENIGVSTERLLTMVEKLSYLSKLNSEELRGKKEKVPYGSFVRDAVDRLYPSPGIRIELEMPGKDVNVPVIPERIEQVLSNLIDNALRYTPKDGTITISVKPGEGEVITTVRDTGQGIEPSELPKVFQQFYTTVPKNSLKEYGSGLGLAIAQTIIQNHGGRIWAESVPGKGSTFTFTLPV